MIGTCLNCEEPVFEDKGDFVKVIWREGMVDGSEPIEDLYCSHKCMIEDKGDD